MNGILASATGYEVRRARTARKKAPHGPSPATSGGGAGASCAAPVTGYRPPASPETDRLVREPVFIISSIRSGSTLLRMLLDAHSRLRAPHELHLRRLEVHPTTRLASEAMRELDLDRADLEHLLWDRVLHRELVRSGKSVIVEKTPANAFAWRRVKACWPDARFVFLLRHPASIAASWHDSDPSKRTMEEAVAEALRYAEAVQEARENLSGITVRYEDLTEDPARELRRVCEFLGVEWEPEMVEYGDRASGRLRRGLGDWREKIRTGRVQAARPLPALSEVPEPLRPLCEAWGYTTERTETATG
ncbi:sulfotransferase [Streptomyces taklimakanensis]|uniref:sulfotransferase family protein n=1 Tax=Streptomyces taklimakanensis TaxID=2569853 RepID=UPI003083FC26